MVDIPNKAFAARRSVCAVLQVDHVTYLGGISPVNWQMKSYKRAVKLVGVEYVDCACRGLMFVPPDCASWIFLREADGPLNISEVLTGLFPLLTSQEPPFREALDWFKLAYTADQVGDYVAPVSTVLAQSTVAEGDELLPALLSHLRRRYPEVYSSMMATCWAPEHREIHIREGVGLSGGTSVHSSIKFGAYADRSTNLSLAGINNPSPNLTTVYLDNPLVGPIPEPLEYVPVPGHLGQLSRYPLISIGGGPSTRCFKSCPPALPLLYITRPWMHPPTGRTQPRSEMQPSMGLGKTFGNLDTRGEPLEEFWPQGLERPNPPAYTNGHGGGGQESNWGPDVDSNRPRFFIIRKIGGNPWQNFGRRSRKGLNPPRTPTGTGGGVR